MELTQISSEFQDIKYQIQLGTDKSKVIFEDQVYIISTVRAKRFAVYKCKKLKRLANKLEKLLLVKKEENLENPLFSHQEITDKSINKKYKYESRHNHATNRRRDDKGRFISRQQRELEKKEGTPESPILIPDHDQFSLSQELVPTMNNEFDCQLHPSEQIQEPYPETPWLEKRPPPTPNQPPTQSQQMSNLQLFTPVLGYTEDAQNQQQQQQQQNLMSMLPLLPEARSMKIEEEDELQQQQQEQEPIQGNHILLIDFLEQRIKKEEIETFEEPVNYFDYLKLEPEVGNVN